MTLEKSINEEEDTTSTLPVTFCSLFVLISEPFAHMHIRTTQSSASTVDAAYERVQKRTFLPMLILVGLFVPLLVGLLLLYPWIHDRSKKRDPLEKEEEDNEEDEETKLIPKQKSMSDSD